MPSEILNINQFHSLFTNNNRYAGIFIFNKPTLGKQGLWDKAERVMLTIQKSLKKTIPMRWIDSINSSINHKALFMRKFDEPINFIIIDTLLKGYYIVKDQLAYKELITVLKEKTMADRFDFLEMNTEATDFEEEGLIENEL